jgi:hypothetical protein
MSVCLFGFSLCLFCDGVLIAAQQSASLEQREPLELAFADSIVPQDRHETMLTTGISRLNRDSVHEASLTQKIEWGISDRLQVSAFSNVVHHSNQAGSMATGVGDFELGGRYTWANVGSAFNHIALAFDAGFPTGDANKGLGEGAYTVAPSVLLSREFSGGRYQTFSTIGFDFVLARRPLNPGEEVTHHEFFANSGLSFHVSHGWAVAELAASTNRWSGGGDTSVMLVPSYVWRFANRMELLAGLPVGLTSASDHIGGIVKFTFELGGREGP